MKILMLVPLIALITACTTTAPTSEAQRQKNNAAERIADHMASRIDHP